MKLYEIIQANNWLTIEANLLRLYPEQKNSIEHYRIVFEALKFLEPKEVAISITLHQYYDDNGQPSVVDVSGINLQPRLEDITTSLAIEFTSWDKWLGMGIDPLTLKEFTEPETICHCLNEMTYAGFDEEEIQWEFSKLKSIMDEYNAMIPEEKAKNTMSLAELKMRINGKN